MISNRNIKPTLQMSYVKLMMGVVGRGLVMASQVDPEIKQEIEKFPAQLTLSMSVYPCGPKFVLKVTKNKQLQLIDLPEGQKADLTILFKHVTHAFMVLSFQEGTAEAMAHDRMIVDGDIAHAIRLVRCLNKMEALILPKAIASLAVKQYPTELSLKNKLNEATQIYWKIAQSYFKRSATHD